ncbi:hypothetical protein RhiJN_03185 [Ceratobasidium sp. AG-Ba]|nr:hypothetical protein RhiJN_03185 [Ceratobasidium sp. AG-Ba]
MVYYRTASHGPYPHPFALSALAPETIAECAGLPGIARGYKTRWDPSSFFLTSIVVPFKMVALLVLATIIGSLVPAVPVPSSLAPVHNATIAYSPRMPFGDLGRTFTSCVGGLLPAGGVSLAVPDFWSSKPPVRRTVCTSHGLRLAATPAQCLAIVSAQLGIPSPTDLTLSPPVALLTLPARRPLLTLPAAPRPVILALPAPIHAPILMLPASKHVPVLMLPAPKLLLTLSGPPDLIPAPAVLLPAVDDLYALPFPTSVAHAAQPSWKVPADLSWSVSGARVFATKYVVDPRKTVTVLVMAYLIVLTSCWMLACIKEDALDLADSFGLLVRCVWVGPPRECLLARLGFDNDGLSVYPGWTTTDAPDELDADAFASSCSVASRGPILSTGVLVQDCELVTASVEHLTLSTEVAVVVAGQESLAPSDVLPRRFHEHAGEPLDDRSDLDTETDDGSSLVTKSIGSAASVSSFDVASNAEANAPGAKEGLETEQVAPVSEPPTEAAVPPPASDIPPRSEPVSNEPRDDCARDEDPETGLSASRWAPGHGSDDEELAAGGIRRRGKRGGRRVQRRRENALARGEEGSSGGVEAAGEVEGAGEGGSGDIGSGRRERGFSNGVWFSHKRRREKRG